MSEARENRIPIGKPLRAASGRVTRIKSDAAAFAWRICTIPKPSAIYNDTLAEDKKTLAATFNLHDTIDYAEIRKKI